MQGHETEQSRTLLKDLSAHNDAFIKHTLRLNDPSGPDGHGSSSSGPQGDPSLWDHFAAVHQSLVCIQMVRI